MCGRLKMSLQHAKIVSAQRYLRHWKSKLKLSVTNEKSNTFSIRKGL